MVQVVDGDKGLAKAAAAYRRGGAAIAHAIYDSPEVIVALEGGHYADLFKTGDVGIDPGFAIYDLGNWLSATTSAVRLIESSEVSHGDKGAARLAKALGSVDWGAGLR